MKTDDHDILPHALAVARSYKKTFTEEDFKRTLQATLQMVGEECDPAAAFDQMMRAYGAAVGGRDGVMITWEGYQAKTYKPIYKVKTTEREEAFENLG